MLDHNRRTKVPSLSAADAATTAAAAAAPARPVPTVRVPPPPEAPALAGLPFVCLCTAGPAAAQRDVHATYVEWEVAMSNQRHRRLRDCHEEKLRQILEVDESFYRQHPAAKATLCSGVEQYIARLQSDLHAKADVFFFHKRECNRFNP